MTQLSSCAAESAPASRPTPRRPEMDDERQVALPQVPRDARAVERPRPALEQGARAGAAFAALAEPIHGEAVQRIAMRTGYLQHLRHVGLPATPLVASTGPPNGRLLLTCASDRERSSDGGDRGRRKGRGHKEIVIDRDRGRAPSAGAVLGYGGCNQSSDCNATPSAEARLATDPPTSRPPSNEQSP